MTKGLLDGSHTGWGKEDADQYKGFYSVAPVTTPETAERAFANIVLKADRALGSEVMEYNDPKLETLWKTE
ncbi:hypothetical protein ACEPPN_016128 [Leptodophora sp. 'Broadleaf-Isolate-01']